MIIIILSTRYCMDVFKTIYFQKMKTIFTLAHSKMNIYIIGYIILKQMLNVIMLKIKFYHLKKSTRKNIDIKSLVEYLILSC